MYGIKLYFFSYLSRKRSSLEAIEHDNLPNNYSMIDGSNGDYISCSTAESTANTYPQPSAGFDSSSSINEFDLNPHPSPPQPEEVGIGQHTKCVVDIDPDASATTR
jgi:hypothetical protein